MYEPDEQLLEMARHQPYPALAVDADPELASRAPSASEGGDSSLQVEPS
jgi:hypothetical protein